jgi:hypothetical protein
MGTDYDAVYDGDDANEVVAIYMTKRQWWHLDDWRAEHADRYPKRAAERAAAWRAIEAAASAGEPPGEAILKAAMEAGCDEAERLGYGSALGYAEAASIAEKAALAVMNRASGAKLPHSLPHDPTA